MQGAQDKVAGECGLDCMFSCFQVADFAHHDDVRILTQNRSQRRRKSQPDLFLDVHLIDASTPLSSEERERLAALRLRRERTLIVINKADLGMQLSPAELAPYCPLVCSLITAKGLDAVKSAMTAMLGLRSSVPPHAVIGERHRQGIMSALRSIKESRELLDANDERLTSCAADSLRLAIQALGAITGRVYHDELLTQIFSRFCIGK